MSKSNAFETELLQLIFNGTPLPGLAENAGSPLAALWISLHTADPGEAGGQNTNEASYLGYVRKSVSRNTSGWTVANGSASPVSDVVFPTSTGGSDAAITHFAVGSADTGAGRVFYRGTLAPNIQMAVGVTPKLASSSTITED